MESSPSHADEPGDHRWIVEDDERSVVEAKPLEWKGEIHEEDGGHGTLAIASKMGGRF